MRVRFSGTLLRFVNYQREHTFSGTCVGEVLNAAVEQFPQLDQSLRSGSGAIRASNMLFLNGEQLDRDDLERPVHDDDTLEILTAIAGG